MSSQRFAAACRRVGRRLFPHPDHGRPQHWTPAWPFRKTAMATSMA